MAKKKERKLYSADDFRELKTRMESRRDELIVAATVAAKAVAESESFADACELRDVAQKLVTLLMDLDIADSSAEGAELRGPVPCFFRLDVYGVAE